MGRVRRVQRCWVRGVSRDWIRGVSRVELEACL